MTPPGIQFENAAETVILFRRQGEQWVIAFGSVWLLGWTILCIWLLYSCFSGARMDDGRPIPLWFVAAFWAFEFGAAFSLMFKLFSVKRIVLGDKALVVSTRLFRMEKISRFSRSDITCILLDDADDEGGADLGINEKPTRYIIRDQRRDRLEWLAGRLAQWAGVPVLYR